ncbi:hypothetical protein FYL10_09220 [Lactobacillus salivarius]|uniref:Uncharacterized protein n=1 Tax=Ligilactobacillus salivarius TaxID=1624 RepID=A0ABD6J9W8_9LACO|nr:hypothetical protein [Ligilactobacillus salivarius]MYY21878.1 hypothetical protein [Ligilactobacillus salivarius]MYY73813.1 hypothetical protein [Ligilactobacillus salivarius]
MKLNPYIIDLIQDALNSIPNGTKKAFSLPEVDQRELLSHLKYLHLKYPSIFSEPDFYFNGYVNVVITKPIDR